VESSQDLVAENVTYKYYFGFPCWRPKWMQTVFANAKFFTVLLCINGLVEGALASGEFVHLL
jgi:hypothetical protein